MMYRFIFTPRKVLVVSPTRQDTKFAACSLLARPLDFWEPALFNILDNTQKFTPVCLCTSVGMEVEPSRPEACLYITSDRSHGSPGRKSLQQVGPLFGIFMRVEANLIFTTNFTYA